MKKCDGFRTKLTSSWPGLTRPSRVFSRVDARLLDGRLKGGHDELWSGANGDG